MAKKKIIAIWGKCAIDITPSLENDKWPEGYVMEGSEKKQENGLYTIVDDVSFASIGEIEEQTTTLSYSEGNKNELKGTGGDLVDFLETEGSLTLETTVIEPTELYKTLGLTDDEINGAGFKVKTHVVSDRFAMRLTPQRAGGWGIKAPVCQISFAPAGEEAKGGSAKVTFTILKGAQDYLYEKFQKGTPKTEPVTA